MNSFHLSLLRKVFICVWPEGRWRIPLLPRRCRQVWNFCMSPPVTIKTKALSWACHLRLISKAAEIAGDGLIEYVDSNTPCLSLLHAHLLSCRVRGSGLSFGNREGGHNTLFQYIYFFRLPDCSSEAVLQRCGAYIKDVDLGEPGVDAGHLSKQRTVRLKTNRLFEKWI